MTETPIDQMADAITSIAREDDDEIIEISAFNEPGGVVLLIEGFYLDYGSGTVKRSKVVESPSGWTFRSQQENGDQVDCWECGNPLDDDHPIVNDPNQFAYHEDCLASLEA